MSVKIIAGKLKGMNIDVPNSARATLGRARKSLFDTLESLKLSNVDVGEFFKNKIVIDCFAGSGAIGLETLSRGAKYAYFIDIDRSAIQQIKANISKLKMTEFSTVICSDIRKLKNNSEHICDFAFFDPPFHVNMDLPKIVTHLIDNQWIGQNTIVVIETPKNIINLENFKIIATKKVGTITFSIYTMI
ncbi:MAG: RsmD family RNA methyltransferase [Alphaproteobacteria bacterium]|nr:RsmD family RNA methyltransferase [Alphaproteobacteria bacterium]